MTPRDVIAKLEKADKGSDQLNDFIYEVMRGYQKASAHYVSGGIACENFWVLECDIGPRISIGPSPSFTYDLEEARTLLPTGWRFSVEGPASKYQQGHHGACEVWCDPAYADDDYEKSTRFRVEAATPEIAVCIAALKIRDEKYSAAAKSKEG